ncbi:MAG: hypothetical protein A3E85_05325 [Gammaproteobacteria bacterium RIFCSPHIGHO2_12_FULL_45_12]|nr:MAG: hypothetical protein A3E85_05325 [Gammaproteobacteria bacterium RIFCSPHIGHO2_12_FULL_45_12]
MTAKAPRPPQNQPGFWPDMLWLSIVLGALFFVFLGNRPLFVPDEGRYAEIAREMFNSGDYVTPTLNGIRYFEKPPLFYWLETIAIHFGGLNLWSLRSINALLGLLGCLATYAISRHLFNRLTGLLSALILSTSLLYFTMTHMISLDMPVTLFITLSLYLFLTGTNLADGFSRRICCWSAASAAALAVLCKGLIGLLFPLMIIGAWISITGQWRLLKRLYLPSSLLLFGLIALPWHWLVNLRNPGFFHFYFIEQHFLRYATTDIGHYQPVWFFIPCLILGFFPWIFFLPQTLAAAISRSIRHLKQQTATLFFLVWAIMIFAFFSFSKSKLIPYILPLFPALAILTGHHLAELIQQNKIIRLKISFCCLFIGAIIIAYALNQYTFSAALPHPALAKHYLNAAGILLLLGSLAACLFAFRNDAKAIGITVITSGLFSLSLLGAAPAIDARTILPFAQKIKPLLTAGDEVMTINQYYQDLPFYLERRVSIVNWRNELSYGMQQQDTHEWMINTATFWQRWHSKQRVFAVLGLDEYAQLVTKNPNETIFLLGKTPNNALICNQPI